MDLSTPIEYLKGIGPERSKLIKNVLGISTVEDFLYFFPLRYLDKSKVYRVADLKEENVEIQLKGRIYDLKEITYGRGQKRLSAKFRDETGALDLVWFQYTQWLKDQIPLNKELYIFGRVSLFGQQFSMAHPEIELEEKREKELRLRPIYPSSEKITKRGLNQKFFQGIQAHILGHVTGLVQENLPQSLLQSLRLMGRQEAFVNIHFPKDTSAFEQADRRLKFEEAFFFQLGYALKKQYNKTSAVGNPFPLVGDFFNDFYQNRLPFELTNAQKRVLKEIRNDMMAPTEILAQQHFNSLSEALFGTGVNIRLLTGSTKAAERKIIHSELENGTLHILVGTHAVLEDKVKFKNLGLAIIDEQHRFGVEQRSKLWMKNKIPPHILIMTATPIPRTLAMSFYSDLDVSVIDELPMGRKPIITAHRREKDRNSVFRFAKDEIDKGRQVYFVYPLIEESEALDYENLMGGFERVSEAFPYPDYAVTMLHGKMKPQEKDEAMQYFASGKANIMVATTVIEVGVNVPNASVMIIESAERFGLSQLHQLRGRVGRGAEQSYCILMTSDKMSFDSRTRIKTMCETNDGFKISEVDMKLRGPGDILGTQQSGVVDFKRLDLAHDGHIIKAAKDTVEALLRADPSLQMDQHQALKNYYIKQYKGKNKWGRIS